MQALPKIEKCPYCNSEAELGGAVLNKPTRVFCTNKNCRVSGPISNASDIAIQKWNRVAEKAKVIEKWPECNECNGSGMVEIYTCWKCRGIGKENPY